MMHRGTFLDEDVQKLHDDPIIDVVNEERTTPDVNPGLTRVTFETQEVDSGE